MSAQENSADEEIMGHLLAEDVAIFALKQIARGRKDCGRPIAGRTSQHLARTALVALQEDW